MSEFTLPAAPRPRHPIKGVLLKLLSLVLFSGMAASVKYIDAHVPTGEIIFVRCLIAVLVLTLIAWRTVGLQVLKTRNWQHHASRSLVGTFSMYCLFTSLSLIPLADVTAITFTTPLFVTVLAMLFLGERIHGFRWTALGIGLVGVLITMGPHLQLGGGLGILAAFGAALSAAAAMIFVRSMSGGEHAITITFYFMLTSMTCALLTLPSGWVMPSASQTLALLLAGVFGVSGQLTMTYSFRYAEASTIAPLDYTSMIWAVILGYVLFDEIPGWSIWLGAPLVIASGLTIFWREYQLQQRSKQIQATPIV